MTKAVKLVPLELSVVIVEVEVDLLVEAHSRMFWRDDEIRDGEQGEMCERRE